MKTFTLNETEYSVTDKGDRPAFVTLSERIKTGEVTELALAVQYAEKQSPSKLTVEFSLPCIAMFSSWTPGAGYKKGVMPDWSMFNSPSRAACWMPVLSIMDASANNRVTVAVSDYKTPLVIRAGVREETGEMVFRIEFFTQLVNPIDAYHTVIRIDRSVRPFYRAVREVQQWWDMASGERIVSIPETARLPVYSTWYNFHQALDVDAIVRECEIARELGMDSVIVDDGWQTVDNQRGYAYCGDWEHAPEKVGNMRGFVDRVHRAGFKFILWFSVPFVGIHSKAYERFRGKFLREQGADVHVLDPRFPEVREYLVELYRKCAVEYDLDGFKLDFIDAFELGADSTRPNPARDCDSLEEAIELLLEATSKALREIKPDMCIEFRQGYVGPLMRKYGNMLRVGDCPADALRNRTGVIDLRLTSGDTPVHSDMLMWHVGESVEDASRQVAATLFGVPQISILLNQFPEAHLRMLRFYLAFWRANRDVLLDGELTPQSPEQNYPVVAATNGGKTIAAIYGNSVYQHDATGDSLTVVNSGGSENIYLDFGQTDRGATCETIDCMGTVLNRLDIASLRGVRAFRVPVGGMLAVRYCAVP